MMLISGFLSLVLSAAPVVNYAVVVETQMGEQSWQPIERADVERILDNTALAPLGQAGIARYAKVKASELQKADYSLLVMGRFIQEAEDFAVYLTFGPGGRTDLPSFFVSQTVNIGKIPKVEMQKRIEVAANMAGKRLRDVLDAQLKVGGAPVAGDALAGLVWQWTDAAPSELVSPKKLVRDLADVRNPDHQRLNAIGALAAVAMDEAPARTALERCMLYDPSSEARWRCADALEPMARQKVQTQRLFLTAMRHEFDPKVLGTLVNISRNFPGLSRKEAIDTWLYLAASEATPGEAAQDIGRVLSDEGYVPNLEAAVSACLGQQSMAYGKKLACAESLLPHVPAERREAVVMPYLKGASSWELGTRQVVEEVLRQFGGRSRAKDVVGMSKAMCELLAAQAAKPQTGQARVDMLSAVTQCKDPSATMIGSLVQALPMADVWMTVRPLVELGDDYPAARPAILDGLKQYQAKLEKEACTPEPNKSEPLDEVRKAIARLSSAK